LIKINDLILKAFLHQQMLYLLCPSPLLIEHPLFSSIKSLLLSYGTLFILTLVSSLFMNLRLPLFSFKIRTSSSKDYSYQIFIIISSLPAFYFLGWASVPLIILIYLILNFLKNSITETT